MHPKPLEEGETAVFELLNANKFTNKFAEDGRRLPSNPAVFQVTEMDVVYDVEKKTNLQIGNVVAENPRMDNGKTIYEPVLKPIWITDGRLELNHTQNDTYMYLMRVNENISNKFRDPKKRATFRLVDEVAEKNQRIAYDILEDDAILLVVNSSMEDLLAIAQALPKVFQAKVSMNGAVDEVRHDLRNIIRRGNPEVILKASTNQAAKVKVQIVEAEKWNIISQKGRDWVDFDDKKIISVETGKTMLDGLVEFFKSKDGKDFYQNKFIPEIKNRVSKL